MITNKTNLEQRFFFNTLKKYKNKIIIFKILFNFPLVYKQCTTIVFHKYISLNVDIEK